VAVGVVMCKPPARGRELGSLGELGRKQRLGREAADRSHFRSTDMAEWDKILNPCDPMLDRQLERLHLAVRGRDRVTPVLVRPTKTFFLLLYASVSKSEGASLSESEGVVAERDRWQSQRRRRSRIKVKVGGRVPWWRDTAAAVGEWWTGPKGRHRLVSQEEEDEAVDWSCVSAAINNMAGVLDKYIGLWLEC
jgi:hypothetical protein